MKIWLAYSEEHGWWAWVQSEDGREMFRTSSVVWASKAHAVGDALAWIEYQFPSSSFPKVVGW